MRSYSSVTRALHNHYKRYNHYEPALQALQPLRARYTVLNRLYPLTLDLRYCLFNISLRVRYFSTLYSQKMFRIIWGIHLVCSFSCAARSFLATFCQLWPTISKKIFLTWKLYPIFLSSPDICLFISLMKSIGHNTKFFAIIRNAKVVFSRCDPWSSAHTGIWRLTEFFVPTLLSISH